MFYFRYLFERALYAYFYVLENQKNITLDERRDWLYNFIFYLLFCVVTGTIALCVRVYSDYNKIEYNGVLVVISSAIYTILIFVYYKYIKFIDVTKEKYDRISDSDKKRRLKYWIIIVTILPFYLLLALFISAIFSWFIIQ